MGRIIILYIMHGYEIRIYSELFNNLCKVSIIFKIFNYYIVVSSFQQRKLLTNPIFHY